MNKKGITTLILICLLMIGLAACSSSEDPAQDSSAEVEVSSVEIEATEAADPSEAAVSSDYSYPIVDTNQGTCYNNRELIDCPAEGEAFYGQDAQYT